MRWLKLLWMTICDEVIVVTRPESYWNVFRQVWLITDIPEYAGCGPLAGILSAMESVEADRYVVLPCDMPYVDGEVMLKLVDASR